MFGVTVPLSKLALGWLDPTWLAVVRFGLAAPVLALVARHDAARRRPRCASRPGARSATARWSCCRTSGSSSTSVTHAALIFGAVPVFVAAGSALAGRAVAGPAAWTGFAVALGGVALVAGSGGDGVAGRRRARARLRRARRGADRGPGRAARGPRPGRGDRRADGRRRAVLAAGRAAGAAARRGADAGAGDRAGRARERRLADPVRALRLRPGARARRAGGRVRQPRAGRRRRRRACSRSATRSASRRRSAPSS